jgi:F0F1-type ATP synthase delta subunit
MKDIAESYALGLYNCARALGCERPVCEELGGLAQIIQNCGRHFSGSPLPEKEKACALREALARKTHLLTLEFALLLLARRQLKQLPAAARKFRELCGEGGEPVRLRVAFELDAALLERLKARLAEEKLIPARHAANARLEISVDPELLGGFVAQYGGYQLDSSLKTALKKITRHEEALR